MKLVSLVKGNDRKKNIKKALNLIKKDLKEIKNKKNVLIKPNLTALSNKYANTNIDAVRAIIEFLNENFSIKKITIGEGSGSAYFNNTTTTKVFKNFGYDRLEKEYKNVGLESFDNCTDCFTIPIKTAVGISKARIVKRVRDFDYIISAAVPKTHNYGIATFGIKNMMGAIKQEDKVLIHGLKSDIDSQVKTLFDIIPPWLLSKARRTLPNKIMNMLFIIYPKFRKSIKAINYNLLSLAKAVYPDLVVLDGFIGMEGDGPIDGSPVKLKAAIASTDALKADGVAARIMGFKPEGIGYLYHIQKAGLGDYSLKGLVGSKIEDVAVEFRPHGTYKIQKQWKN